jgi:ankyrin repeat protein
MATILNGGHRSSFSRPALLKALKSGDRSAFDELLKPRQVPLAAIENDLRIALQTAAGEGETELVRGLLQRGAKTDLPNEKGTPPLQRAVDKGHTEIVRLLLRHEAATEARDKHGRTPLMSAALSGQNKILELLLQYGANVDAYDHDHRTVLLNLAADTTKIRWNQETINIVLATRTNVEHVDRIGRTALHWCAATGKSGLAEALLNNSGRQQANMNAVTERGRTALHLAAEADHGKIVELLLACGAKTEATSDGYWTPLLNAAQNGHHNVVDLLLNAKADINAKTSSGMTALHWAAENGHLVVVQRILKEEKAQKNLKDGFDSTPLSRAGQHGHQEIIQELKPHIFGGSLSLNAKDACQRFNAAIVDFYFDEKTVVRNVVKRKSVWECLYAPDPKDSTGRTFAITTSLKDIRPRPPDFRWIHLPANNIAWAEALITKFFLERGFTDPGSFKAMLRLFGQRQHRGRKVHSRFMRPLCQRIGGTQVEDDANRRRRRSRDSRGSPIKPGATRPLSLVPEMSWLRQESIVVLFVSGDPFLLGSGTVILRKSDAVVGHLAKTKVWPIPVQDSELRSVRDQCQQIMADYAKIKKCFHCHSVLQDQ